MDLNAVNVFQPMGFSPILTDICLVELDENSVDEFNTPEQSPVYDTDPSDIDYNDSPCTIADPYDWSNDDINDICETCQYQSNGHLYWYKTHYASLQTLHKDKAMPHLPQGCI